MGATGQTGAGSEECMRTLSRVVGACAALVSLEAAAQVYAITQSSQAYSPLTNGTVLPLTGTGSFSNAYDDGFGTIQLSFNFPFFGKSYNSIGVNTNGLIMIGPESVLDCSQNACRTGGGIPRTTRTHGHNFVAPWWADLTGGDATTHGDIRYVQTATQIAIEFSNWEYYGSITGGTFNFTVTLKSNGDILVHYGSHAGLVERNTSMGFENADGTYGQPLLPCSATTNACSAWPGDGALFTVGPPSVPELVVNSVSISNMVVGVDITFDVSAAIQNFGKTATGGFQWAVYLSLDTTLTPATDYLVLTSPSVSLGGSATSTFSGSASRNPTVPNGSYYVLVVADSGNTVAEYGAPAGGENNNVTASSYAFIIGAIDLVAKSVEGPLTASSDTPLIANLSFFNQGSNAAGNMKYKVVVSTDKVVDPTDFVGASATRTVSGAESVDLQVSITLPTSLTAGDYYLGLQLDADQVVAETSESNNVVFSSQPVKIVQPDLVSVSADVVDALTGVSVRTGRLGDVGRVKVILRNSGGVDTKPVRLSMALSVDTSLSLLSDTLFHDEVLPVIPVGQSTTLYFNVTFPLKDKNAKDLATGNYYLFAIGDSFAEMVESSETNNNVMVAGPVLLRAPSADYTVRQMDIPATAGVGEVMPVYRVIANIGNVNGGAMDFRYYASVNDIITDQDVPLEIVNGDGSTSASRSLALNAGTDDRGTEFVRLPALMPGGTYYVGCRVDVGDAVSELQEDNNSVASRTTVVVARAALAVLTSQLPDGTVNRPYGFGLGASGGNGSYVWSYDPMQGALPTGLSLSADGTVSGTPVSGGIFAFTTVVESGGAKAYARLVLRVSPSVSEIAVLTDALIPIVNSPNQPYQAQLAAAGGQRPYQWRVVSGALPAGIDLASDGVVGGMIKAGVATGESTVGVEVRDAIGGRAQGNVRVRVVDPTALVIATASLPDTQVGAKYLIDLAAANADRSALALPVKWSIASGTLPPGIEIATQGERGILSGKATRSANFSFTVQIEDAKGRVDVASFVIRVLPSRIRLAFATTPPVIYPGDEVALSLTGLGAGAHYMVYTGRLPPGLSVDSEGKLGGVVDMEDSVGVFNFVVEGSDSSGASAVGAFVLEVLPRPPKTGCSAAPGSGPPWWALLAVVPLAWMRRRSRFGFLFGLLAACLALAPRAAQAAPTGITYEVRGPTAAPYAPLGASAISLKTGTVWGGPATIPFPFMFYGNPYSSVEVSRYGYLVFSGDAQESYNDGIPTTYSYGPVTFIAGWWDYLTVPSGGAIKVQTLGSEPNRVFVAEWSNVAQGSSSTVKFSFQIKLFETSNQIEIAYGPTPPGSTTAASVGIQAQLSEGQAGLGCTTSAAGDCGDTDFPVNSVVDFVLPPDLLVSDVTLDPVIYAGVPFVAAARLKNIGGQPALSAKVRFYLSTDVAWDNADINVGDSVAVASLGIGEEKRVVGPASVPANTVPGTYFLIALADPDGFVNELREDNNVSPPTSATVGGPTPDLVVASISGPAAAVPGQAISLTRAFQNIGNADILGAVAYTFFVSDNSVASVSDVAVSPSGSFTGIAKSGNNTATEQLTLPSTLIAGAYWIGVCVDYDPAATPPSGISEINEVNNCATASAPTIVNTGALAIITGSVPATSQFSAYGVHLIAAGGNGTYTWAHSAGSLPPGIKLTSTGDLLGAANAAGSFSFEVKVSSGGADATKSFVLAVSPASLPLAIVDQELPAAEFGRGYTASLIAVGGKPPYVWQVAAGSKLPEGLALAADGRLEGRAAELGDFPFRVELIDAGGSNTSRDLRIRVVAPAALHIGLSRLPTGYLKKPYSQVLAVAGGKPPYDWSVVKFQQLAEGPTDQPGPPTNRLPEVFGLKIQKDSDTQSQLAGAPLVSGLFSITFRVQDGAGSEDLTTLPLSISYEEGLALTTLALPDAFVGRQYNVRLSHNATDVGVVFSSPCVQQATSTPQGWSYSCAPADPNQAIPPGLELNADGFVTGVPTLPPVQVSGDGKTFDPFVYSFLVRVQDTQGRQDLRSLSIKVRPDYTEGGCGCSGTGGRAWELALALAVLAALGLRRRG